MHTRTSLTHELKRLGVPQGVPLMVHASLRRIGPTEGRADALLGALLDAIGPDGTLVFAMGADDKAPFDMHTTPCEKDLGVLAELFRQRAGTLVNDHAAARFGACGPQASQLLTPIPLHHYYGQGSPLERFIKSGGMVLRLGADIDTVTITHWAEYQASLPNKRQVRRRYERADTGEEWIESLDDCDGIVEWEGGDYFSQILIDYLAAGRALVGPIGNCSAELFDAHDYATFAIQWMETHLAQS